MATTRECVHRYLAVPLSGAEILKYFGINEHDEEGEEIYENIYDKLENFNNSTDDKFGDNSVVLDVYPCCYMEESEDKYYFGIFIDEIKIDHMCVIFKKIMGKDAKKGIDDFFFSKEIPDEARNELNNMLSNYNITKEPVELIVPDDCFFCT